MNPLLKAILVLAALALAFGAGFYGTKLIVKKIDPAADNEPDTEILIDDDPLIVDELPELSPTPDTDQETEQSADGSESSSDQQAGEQPSDGQSTEQVPGNIPTPEQPAEPGPTDSPLGPNETEILP